MSYFASSVHRGCMAAVLVLLLLTAFCLTNVEKGTGPYYLCLYSLIVDVPFFLYLLVKLIRNYHRIQKERKAEAASAAVENDQLS